MFYGISYAYGRGVMRFDQPDVPVGFLISFPSKLARDEWVVGNESRRDAISADTARDIALVQLKDFDETVQWWKHSTEDLVEYCIENSLS